MLIIEYKKENNWIKLDPYYVNAEGRIDLSKVSEFSFQYPVINRKSADLVERTEIRFREGEKIEFAGYIIRIEKVMDNNELLLYIKCETYLIDFTNKITVPNKSYINENIEDLLDPDYVNTVIKSEGWTTVVEPTNSTFSYLSSLQSSMSIMNNICVQANFNYRMASTLANTKTIEFGEFGVLNSVRIRQKPATLTSNTDDLLLIDENGLTKTIDSASLINKIYPLGGGGDNGLNQLTLRDTNPDIIAENYPIYIDDQTPNDDQVYDPAVFDNSIMGPNSYQAFYLKDQESIDKYGLIERPIIFNDIYPISSNGETFTENDRKIAATQLYIATRWVLINRAYPQISYDFTCYGNPANLKVGDKVNLKYKGEVLDREQNKFIYEDINENYYLVEAKVTWGENETKRYDLRLSTYPRKPRTDLDVISETIETVQESTKQRKGSVTTYPVYFEDSFDNTNPAQFLYWIPPQTVYLDYIEMKVRIKPFRAYSKATQGGGATTATSSAGGATTQSTAGGGNHTHDIGLPNHTHGISAITTNSEGTGTGAHQHTVLVNKTSSDRGTLESLGYKYLMVQPAAGITASPCVTFGTIGQLWAPSSFVSPDNNPNGVNFKTNCTIQGHTHSINATSTSSGGGAVTSSNASGDHTHSVTIPNHTHNVSLPNHTHAIEFGIYQDPSTATNIKIFIDNIDFSPQLGIYNTNGDFPSNAQQNFDILKAAQILGVLEQITTPGAHTIEVKCSSGRAKAQLFMFNQFYLSSK